MEPNGAGNGIKNEDEAGFFSAEAMEGIMKKISSLAIENGWRIRQPLLLYQGFWCFPLLLDGVILAQEHLTAQPSDIFVCSFPKSGTTWLKALTFAIATRSRFDCSQSPLLTTNPQDCIPTIEALFGKKPELRQPGLPIIATHIPYSSLPKSALDSDCKLVYICRDPKDAFVSWFHFVDTLRSKEVERISLEEAFDLYCEGRSLFGPIWYHILGYWKASLERPDKVLFLKYEDMMKNNALNVKKLAAFMGFPFTSEEEEQGEVQKIVELCSFEFLTSLEINKSGLHMGPNSGVHNKDFFRKGKVGDWKNHLTPEMAERLDKIMEKELRGTGLTFNA